MLRAWRLRAAPPLRPCVSPQVFQRREDGTVNFFRGWEAYRDGFGKLTGEHWLGAWGWQCHRMAKPGAPPPQTGLGFALQRKGHQDPLSQRSVWAGWEGTGWLQEGREAMGLSAAITVRDGGWELLSILPQSPSPGTPSHLIPTRVPALSPSLCCRAEADPRADGAGQLRAPHRPGGL